MRVPVRVCNLSSHPVKILPNSVVCVLNVKVVDSWNPEPPQTMEVSRTTILVDLGVSINSENLTPEQLHHARQMLGS